MIKVPYLEITLHIAKGYDTLIVGIPYIDTRSNVRSDRVKSTPRRYFIGTDLV